MCAEVLEWLSLFAPTVTAVAATISTIVAILVYRKAVTTTDFNRKVDAMTEYLEHGRRGVLAVLFRFGRSKGVMKALRNYTDKVGKQKDAPFPQSPPFKPRQAAAKQCRKDVHKAYDEVIRAMCKDTNIEYDEYLTILGFSKGELWGKYRTEAPFETGRR